MMQKAETPSTASSEKKIVMRVCASKQFPGKLHDLLTYAETNGLDWVISWCHDGKAFIVHSQEHLLQILPIFFGQTKFRSFQRQLNMWHFERVLVGPFKGAFMHPSFVRGNKALCASMSRHHLPSAEMYSRALLEGASGSKRPQRNAQTTFNQYILDNRPDQLVTIDRNQLILESPPLKGPRMQTEWMKTMDTIGKNDAKLKAKEHSGGTAERPAPIAHHIREKMSDVPSLASISPPHATNGEKDNDVKDQEEDWSLLSDCLQHVLNPETPTSNYSPNSHTNNEDPIRFPLDALAPGMEEPASPEAIEDLFAEFNS